MATFDEIQQRMTVQATEVLKPHLPISLSSPIEDRVYVCEGMGDITFSAVFMLLDRLKELEKQLDNRVKVE